MKTRIQVFSCEICEIFKNKYFKEYLRTTASSGSSYLNIRAFDESSFPLSIYCYDNQKKSFSCFHGNHCLGKKFRHQNHTAYKSKLFPKDKRRKTAQEKLLRRCDFYHFIIPEKFSIGLTRLVFLKSSWWSVWIFRAQELPKGTILSSIILCLAIFKEQFSVAAPSTECLWSRILQSSSKL